MFTGYNGESSAHLAAPAADAQRAAGAGGNAFFEHRQKGLSRGACSALRQARQMSIKQREILNQLSPDFARDGEAQSDYIERKRVQILNFISEYTRRAHARGWVIGISGGIDSFLVGALLALDARNSGSELIAVMLPNGQQADIDDARECAEAIARICPATNVCTVNIHDAYTGMLDGLAESGIFPHDPYSTGNIQPRLRMVAQYALAKGLLVAGTDHTSEAVTGFYTKYGDGGVDFNPIGQMIKDDIYDMSARIGAPKCVMEKAPAAGIGISVDDESELGISYKDICAFLKGNRIGAEPQRKIVRMFDVSAHKRRTPPTTAWLYERSVPLTHVHCGNGAEEASIRYMNEHQDQEVLYVGTDSAAYVRSVEKTVNTTIRRYNWFDAEQLHNDAFGSLRENVHQHVLLTGDRRLAQTVAHALTGSSTEYVEGCLTK